jgi:membrane-bound lytic murein transglycosylase F
MGHVADARVLARKLRLDPDKWFGNVEQAMLLLEKPRYYRRARRGYVRGSEPVGYVSFIQGKYEAFAALMPAQGLEPLKD